MLDNNGKLIVLKSLHTLIWLGFNLVLAYLFYAVLTQQVDGWFWAGIGLIALECLVLLIFRWRCPLTYIAQRYTDDRSDNFDIYLPVWVARHNKLIYSTIFGVLVVLYLVEVVLK
jgi:hypothetical protein